MTKDLLGGFLFCSNSHLIWEDLGERFDKINSYRTFKLHKEIFTSVQGVSLVSDYYSKLKDLWDEYNSIMPPHLCDCPKLREFFEYLQYQRVLQFFMGLNDNYSQDRSQILMMPQVPTVNQVYVMINQDENQSIVAGASTLMNEYANPAAMLTSRTSGDSYKKRMVIMDICFVITATHIRGDCDKLKKRDFCYLTRHVRLECYRLIGYPANFKGQGRANMGYRINDR